MSLSAMLLKRAIANSRRVSAMDGRHSRWDTDRGDTMYVKAFDDDTILDTETLSQTYLPDRVHWPTMTADPAKPNQYLPFASEKHNVYSCFI